MTAPSSPVVAAERLARMVKRPLRAALRRGNFAVTVELLGRKFRLPVILRVGSRLRGSHEPWLLALLEESRAGCDGAFVDVGANIGQTLVKVKAVDPAWEYVGFEPNPHSASYLMQFAAANEFDACTIFPVGIGRKTGVMRMWMPFETAPRASTRQSADSDHNQIVIHAPMLGRQDAARALTGVKLGFLKVDVEGAEADVLDALRDEIRRDRPVIVLEILPPGSVLGPDGRSAFDELERLIECVAGLDYQFNALHVDGRVEPVQLDRTGRTSDGVDVGRIGTRDFVLTPIDRSPDQP